MGSTLAVYHISYTVLSAKDLDELLPNELGIMDSTSASVPKDDLRRFDYPQAYHEVFLDFLSLRHQLN